MSTLFVQHIRFLTIIIHTGQILDLSLHQVQKAIICIIGEGITHGIPRKHNLGHTFAFIIINPAYGTQGKNVILSTNKGIICPSVLQDR